jgi:allantoinase
MTQGIYDTTQPYPRDLIGYGRKPPQAKWPGGARIAVQFVLNYEEGGENAVLHGDPGPNSSCPKCSTRRVSQTGI